MNSFSCAWTRLDLSENSKSIFPRFRRIERISHIGGMTKERALAVLWLALAASPAGGARAGASQRRRDRRGDRAGPAGRYRHHRARALRAAGHEAAPGRADH